MHGMKRSPIFAFCLALAAFLGFPGQGHGQKLQNWPRLTVSQAGNSEPMQLKEMFVHSRIVGLQAEVTTALTFYNPNPRQLEGELSFPLPDGALVTGYALDIGGKMIDGVVVKKEKARVAFETEARRRVDPGLVEHVAGNVYRTRIYPLPPQGTRRIQLRFVTPLAVDAKGDAAWHLPMPLGETVGELSIRVEVVKEPVTPEIGGFGNLRFRTVENQWIAETKLADAKPGEDLWVTLPRLPRQVASVERTPDGETFFSLSDFPGAEPVDHLMKAPPTRVGIAWDASGSRTGDHAKELAMLKELLERWHRPEVVLVVFRNKPEPARVFTGDPKALMDALGSLPYDGGTDLAALAPAIKEQKNIAQWLFFSDGLETLGGTPPNLSGSHVTGVVSQTVADREGLRQLCAASGGALVDLQTTEPKAAAEAVVFPAPRVVRLRGTGIAEVQGLGAQVQGRVQVCGKLLADEAELSLEYSDGRVSPPVKLSKNTAPEGTLIGSVWAGQRIAQLGTHADDNEEELLALGRRFGTVSPATSLIVLENLDQYVRNDIEPPASLPEMRQAWADRKAATTKNEAARQTSKLERVVAMWNARVQWWKDPVPKPVAKESPLPQTEVQLRPARPLSASTGNSEDSIISRTADAPAGDGDRSNADRRTVARLGNGNTYTGSTTVSAGTITVLSGAVVVGSAAPTAKAFEVADAKNKSAASPNAAQEAKIAIQPWNPATPYLAVLKAASKETRYDAYLKERPHYANSPAFFVDCGDWFLKEGEPELGLRILTNLAEMKLEDAALLRVLAWRMEQAGELDRAIVLFRKAGKLRPEEPQSLRDLALALAERGKTRQAVSDISESMALLQKMIFGEWQRFDEIEVIGLEELNALIAWTKTQPWDKAPVIPQLDPRLTQNLDCDVRIVLCWDADNTDVDLHVLEPGGEEAFYGHNRTSIGGLVSRDFTQGYGPEEYLLHGSKPGVYKVFAHYFGSHQQTITGAATIAATVFTDFGRPTEKKQVLTLRLDRPSEKADVGQIEIGGDHASPAVQGGTSPAELFRALSAGLSENEIKTKVGEPQAIADGVWTYQAGNRTYRIIFTPDKKLSGVVEVLPGGAEMTLVQ